jgi:hypothetical protein
MNENQRSDSSGKKKLELKKETVRVLSVRTGIQAGSVETTGKPPPPPVPPK